MTVNLSNTQQSVVSHEDGALLVVAGPGSGKTRVLTERVRRLLGKPDSTFRVLALTFTTKAANEMMQRLEDVPDIRQRAFVGTLHSFCMEVLANRGKTVGISSLPHIFESYDDRREILANAIGKDPYLAELLLQGGREPKQRNNTLSRWLSMIGDAKNSLRVPALIDDDDERKIYEAYDAELRSCDAVDYDDLLLLTYRLFEERPKIADFYRRQYRYICVDEAQDLNKAQYELLCSLCGKDYLNVMMVGDPKQAIYVFNGADPKYMSFFSRDFKARTITLADNFRCSSSVLVAAQGIDPSYIIEGQLPIEGRVEIHACDNESSEAEFVTEQLKRLMTHGHSDIEGELTLERCAILGRSRFVFPPVEKALKDAGLKFYKKLSAAAYRSESALVEQFELALRLVANPLDRLHLEILASKWKTTKKAEKLADDGLLRTSTGLEVIAAIGGGVDSPTSGVILEALGLSNADTDDFRLTKGLDHLESYAQALPDEERAGIMTDCAEWHRHWDAYVRSEAGGRHSVGAFLGQIALGITNQTNEEGVALLTVHSAKGLEFDVVFLVGMNEGTLPDYRAQGSALDEEKRSAFVAVTRSRRLLFMTYPKEKLMPWGDAKRQQPSRYLALMDKATIPNR